MSFIETLKSVGGVKPCSFPQCSTKDGKPGRVDYVDDATSICSHCHGTGQILDLAPLLANPKELGSLMPELLFGSDDGFKEELICNEQEVGVHDLGWYIVGPQRASNLVYEVARQLGGTAVVAERRNDYCSKCNTKLVCLCMDSPEVKYRLSLPIPPDATVLFVTDRLDEKEVQSVISTVRSNGCSCNGDCDCPRIKRLPYILSLVSPAESVDPYETKAGEERCTPWKVISLHQENA